MISIIYTYHNVLHTGIEPRGDRNMTTDNQNQKNIENIERLIAHAQAKAAQQTDIAKRYAWLACRDHLQYAATCLRLEVPDYDRAGAHLVRAHRIMAEEVRA